MAKLVIAFLFGLLRAPFATSAYADELPRRFDREVFEPVALPTVTPTPGSVSSPGKGGGCGSGAPPSGAAGDAAEKHVEAEHRELVDWSWIRMNQPEVIVDLIDQVQQ